MILFVLTLMAMPVIFYGLRYLLRSKQSVFEKQLSLGLKHLTDGEAQEAELHFRAALVAAPGKLKASYAAAMQAYTMRHYGIAAPLFAKCVELAPGYYACWLRYAHCLTRLENRGLAARAYARAAHVKPQELPKSINVTLHEALASAAEGDLLAATNQLTALIDEGHASAEIYYERACCFAVANRLDAAIADLLETIKLDKSFIKDIDEDWRLKGVRELEEFPAFRKLACQAD